MKTSTLVPIWITPKTANIVNQISIIGAKNFPTNLVPNCWMVNNTNSIAITIGTVGISGLKIRNPSTAEETEIGGVIIPSASKALPPIMAGTISHWILVLFTKAYKAKIPPSPWLSALKVIITYFKVVCKVKVQKIQERPPKIKSLEIEDNINNIYGFLERRSIVDIPKFKLYD